MKDTKLYSDKEVPFMDTRWFDKDNRVTRLGFIAGCIERKTCTFNNGSEFTVTLSYRDAQYCVQRSDWKTFDFSNDSAANVFWLGSRLKEARKVMTAMVQCRPVADALRDKCEV